MHVTYRILILLSLTSKVNHLSIKISGESYKAGLKHYKNNLQWRLITSKGNMSLKTS